ncbi:DUF2779 domain-containing protein [Mycoplasmatota bacterium]|nr:DUF2779 domain-containing protein [Mycoplasmatota bacterium]
MNISKTRFINHMRCNRYAGLESLYQDKDQAIVAFSDDPDLDELMSQENKDKMSFLLDDMYDEEDQDLLSKVDTQMETMLPYYNQIEIIAGQAIDHRFEGKTVYSLDTYKQKRFQFEHQGYQFYCFLDGYQEDDKSTRIFEVKATTSKKFLDMKFKNDDGDRVGVFEYSPEGILMFREDLLGDVNDDYFKKTKKLKDRLSKAGRYIYDIAYQRYVFEHTNEQTKNHKYYLAILNSEYIHDGKTDEQGRPVYPDELIVFLDVTKFLDQMMPVIEQDIQIVIERLNALNANEVNLGPHCQRKDSRQCKFYPICYKKVPTYNSIFTYLGGHNGFKDTAGIKHERFDLLNEGYLNATDIPYDWLNRENNQLQRKVIDSGEPYVAKDKIKAAIESLKYPIYHLDFETFPCPLPRFKGEKPYSQSLFQYSIHIEHEPGVCDVDEDNYSYIATKHNDLREDLIINMLDVIKDDEGSIMAYNISFEKTRLKEMAIVYPKYAKRLHRMMDRLVDLMYFLRGNKKLFESLGFSDNQGFNYYHNDLNGSFSIKKVLPIFSDLTYKGMPIGNGTDALVTYAQFPFMDETTFKTNYNDLLKYCKQDTWAMVEILEALRKIV